MKTIEESIQDGVPWDIDHRIVQADGTVRWISAFSLPEGGPIFVASRKDNDEIELNFLSVSAPVEPEYSGKRC